MNSGIRQLFGLIGKKWSNYPGLTLYTNIGVPKSETSLNFFIYFWIWKTMFWDFEACGFIWILCIWQTLLSKLVRLYSNYLFCQHVHWLGIEPMTLCELWEKEKLKIFHLISNIKPCKSNVIWKGFHLRFQAFRPCCV